MEKNNDYEIAPSLMCMSNLNVKQDIEKLNHLCSRYHFDIMDGCYVENFALTPLLLKEIRQITKLPIDVHLMLNNPQPYITQIAEYGASSISIHADHLTSNAFRTFKLIRDLNCSPGVVLNPSESIDMIKYYINQVDFITVMTIDPGFAGQKFIESTVQKIIELNELRNKCNYHFKIIVDGHCTSQNVKEILEAGADIIVVGNSALFSKSNDVSKAYNIMIDEFQKTLKEN